MMVTNVSLRVLLIKFHDKIATAFYIERDGLQYIITAKHTFEDEDCPTTSTVGFMIEKSWVEKSVKIFYHKSGVDIAVIKLNNLDEFEPKYKIGFKSSIDFGRELYFLGYPYGYSMDCFETSNVNRPLPLIKKGIFSGVLFENDQHIFLLDGHNNPGFSGGPVYSLAGESVFIAGVISGYRYNSSRLYDLNDKEQPYYVKENSGIVRFVDINYALEIIDSIRDCA